MSNPIRTVCGWLLGHIWPLQCSHVRPMEDRFQSVIFSGLTQKHFEKLQSSIHIFLFQSVSNFTLMQNLPNLYSLKINQLMCTQTPVYLHVALLHRENKQFCKITIFPRRFFFFLHLGQVFSKHSSSPVLLSSNIWLSQETKGKKGYVYYQVVYLTGVKYGSW